METVECGDLGFENWEGGLPDCSSSGMFTHRLTEKNLGETLGSELSCKSLDGNLGTFNVLRRNSVTRDFGTNDDTSRGINGIPHHIGCHLDNALAEQMTHTTGAGTKRFSQMDRFMSSGGQLKDGFPELHVKSTNASSSNGKKRKKMFDEKSELARLKVQGDEFDREGSEEKQKLVSDSSCKLEGKTVDETSNCKKDLKEDNVHVKAKRRQSLNNHSRAERIRREKISERMKFLQDIVPGCSKIIGKSAMLDEIINYVLSLQQQIEFLSMKVATVYPEMNLDIQQIPSRDVNNNEIHCSQDGNTMHGGQRIGTFYTSQDEIPYGTFSANRSTNHLKVLVPQVSMWNNDTPSSNQLHNIHKRVVEHLELKGYVGGLRDC